MGSFARSRSAVGGAVVDVDEEGDWDGRTGRHVRARSSIDLDLRSYPHSIAMVVIFGFWFVLTCACQIIHLEGLSLTLHRRHSRPHGRLERLLARFASTLGRSQQQAFRGAFAATATRFLDRLTRAQGNGTPYQPVNFASIDEGFVF